LKHYTIFTNNIRNFIVVLLSLINNAFHAMPALGASYHYRDQEATAATLKDG